MRSIAFRELHHEIVFHWTKKQALERISAAVAVASIFLAGAPAWGQTSIPLENPILQPIIQADRGKVHTCGINYSGFLRDYAYRQGAPVLIVGSLNLMYSKGKLPAATLKLQTSDIVSMPDVQQRPFNPAYGYFLASGKSSAGKEVGSFVCDGGGWCGAFADTEVIASAMRAISGFPFSVGYTRQNGKTDVVASLPGSTQDGLNVCIDTLLKRFEAQD